MKTPIYDDRYFFKGLGGCAGVCHLLVEQVDNSYLVTFTELKENPGASVTNCAESLASQVAQKFGLDVTCTEWFEKYTPDSWVKLKDSTKSTAAFVY